MAMAVRNLFWGCKILILLKSNQIYLNRNRFYLNFAKICSNFVQIFPKFCKKKFVSPGTYVTVRDKNG